MWMGHVQTLITEASSNLKILLVTLNIRKAHDFRGEECDWEKKQVWNLTILGSIITKMCLDILFNSWPQFPDLYHLQGCPKDLNYCTVRLRRKAATGVPGFLLNGVIETLLPPDCGRG